MKKIIILGGGDLANKTAELIKRDRLYQIVGYYNDLRSLNNIKYLGKFSKFYKNNNSRIENFVLAVGGRPELLSVRSRLIKIINKKKHKTPKIISKTAKIHKKAKVGNGCIIFDNAFIDFDVKIDSFSIINIGSIVCHHSAIGKNVVLSPKVLVTGRCKLEGNIFVGSGSIINPKVIIKNNVVIGSMSNVIKNISKKGLYFGNPVKKIN